MNRNRLSIFLFLSLPLLLGILTGCQEDEYHYPSVKLEFMTVGANADGVLSYVITDEGKEYPLANKISNDHFKPDTLIRIISNYELTEQDNDQENALLYGASNAIAPFPLSADKFTDGIKTDPVDVQSIWLGWNYLNMVLEVKAQNKHHKFHFVENEHTTEGNHSTVRLTLYHDNGDDLAAYTQRAYCSIPLWQYATDNVETVAVSIDIHTYSGDIKTYTFEYRPTSISNRESNFNQSLLKQKPICI